MNKNSIRAKLKDLASWKRAEEATHASAQWAEKVRNRRIQFIDINHFPMSSRVSERANERISAAERGSEASSAEQVNE